MTNEQAIAYFKEQLEIFGGEHHEAMKVAIEALEKQRWIPCSERLPKYMEKVIACIDLKVAKDAKHQILIGEYFQEDYWKDGRVKAWMPLPELYKEGDQE